MGIVNMKFVKLEKTLEEQTFFGGSRICLINLLMSFI